MNSASSPVEAPDLVAAANVLAHRLRALPESRLRRPELTRAEPIWLRAHAIAQKLADLTAGLVADRAGQAIVAREVPDHGPFVVADQITVTVADLVAVLAEPGPGRRASAVDGDVVALTAAIRVLARDL